MIRRSAGRAQVVAGGCAVSTTSDSHFDRGDHRDLWFEQHNKWPCVRSVRKDPTNRLGCLLTGIPVPTAEGDRQPRGKARVWVAPPHSLPQPANCNPRSTNIKPKSFFEA